MAGVQILIGLIAILLLGTLGETLGWCYLWYQQSFQATPPQKNWQKGIVFLTGISNYSATQLAPEQVKFLQEIINHYPCDFLIAEPFPYETVTAKKFIKFDIWQYLKFAELPIWAISLHNFWQFFLVANFERIYGATVARCLLNHVGLPFSQESTLILICGSAGAALALAASPSLKQHFKVVIVSYGGVFHASSGLNTVNQLYHLVGARDYWAKFGTLMFPQHWLPSGRLSKAKQENRVKVYCTGCHQHFGKADYLSESIVPDLIKTYQDLTLEIVLSLDFWHKIC